MKFDLKKRFKATLKSQATLTLFAFLIACYIKLCFLTIRWQGDAKKQLKKFANQSIILVFWHGRMLMMPKLWPTPQLMHVLISHHRDGELIAKVIHFLGYNTIRGSSSKGGFQAIKQILRTLKNESVAITPDGPRGPCFHLGGHLIDIAMMSQRPIVFACFATQNAKIARSWDQMIMPKLFSKGHLVVSEPITLPKGLAKEDTQQIIIKLNQKFLELTQQADTLANIKLEYL
ncbi:lysophospholipid acyltransferase family protein [Rickettsiales endosymbiont of Stachyamoeba lipophora]|uniref:lysophospholipid acyltransferase family protein n=1 Tax=Rickettsiales endosymbiont of Stachyamoeba lipophora TaxID=2486578 RepID=UPI000F654312|nr:lysophospholipid acyltransferase family protein [Rickettsiales endosymbiont of Stachyamoeba lipophora]AZL15498.1 DUF374 domain-containing protein [Rickettsiales endosymbiont of Stachyamoeba lipophora]